MMKKQRDRISRRDFLKLAALMPAACIAQPLLNVGARTARQDRIPNILILVFDAWSANHLSMDGYPRHTMPNLEKFSERAIVYHNHISAGTFTSPGVASILTGLYPWSHRVFQQGIPISNLHKDHQMFSSLGEEFSVTLGYSQNKMADRILEQFDRRIDVHIPSGAYNIYNHLSFDAPVFSIDAVRSIVFALSSDSSLFVGPLLRVKGLYNEKVINEKYSRYYPKGLPNAIHALFLLESVVARAIKTLTDIDSPFLSYMHFFPPHEPYRPKTRFLGDFRDGWLPVEKKIHPLAVEKDDQSSINQSRRLYDEYLASWDFELGRLFEFLETSGLRETSYIIITSDHGEMFERGERGHWTPLIYESLLHVPLLISRPGQTKREDIYTNTSSVDILPTLAQLAGKPVPGWVEGEVLPGLGGIDDPSRSVYVTDAKQNSVFSSLSKFSLSLTKDHFRLTRYHYPDYQDFEFYDLDEDPEELEDLYPARPASALRMQEELQEKIADVNRPFERG